MLKRRLALAALLTLACINVPAAGSSPYTIEFQELAPGVWAAVRPEGPRPPVMGSTVFVVGNRSVAVFDGGGATGVTERVIDKIRSVTDLPVSDVIISHWHGDHHFGVHRIAQAFPDVRFIGHPFTSAMLESTKVSYVDGQKNYKETRLPAFQKMVESRTSPDGRQLSSAEIDVYRRLIDDIDDIDRETNLARVTPIDTLVSDRMVLDLGNRKVEVLFLGHGNTEGDLVMWLPQDRIVAVGDIVVLPSPYAFNVPPRPWAKTLEAIKALDFAVMVPGHGPVQTDTRYLDLLIEVANDIAGQTDALSARSVATNELGARLDFSAFESRFTGGDELLKVSYYGYFEGPFRAAAVKSLTGNAMVPVPEPQQVPFDDNRWAIEAAESEKVPYLGKSALRLRGGAAILPDVSIQNAIVEFDLAVSGARGFAGLVFRNQGGGNYENFYIRPHQSGNPDANQYQPVFNSVAAWQLYHGEKYSVPVAYPKNEWMHIKVHYAGTVAKVFIDSEAPVLVIDNLKRSPEAGSIGVSVADFAEAHFADFRYMPLADAYEHPYLGKSRPLSDPGVISAWEVSGAFDRAEVASLTQLSSKHLDRLDWTPVESETDGLINLAQVQGVQPGRDTAFARTSIETDTAQTRQLSFGFSDSAVVFVNGKRVYSGDNTYRSRDYRYLGSIGLFDSVTLNLNPGRNEICVAVTENFGGWGLLAKLQPATP